MTTTQSNPGSSNKDRVFIFDTTLRDGEQSPGATMTLEEKLQVAEALDDMGVDIIEAGFPIASNGDFEAVSEVAKRSKNSIIAGLARAIPADIARAGEAVRHARQVGPVAPRFAPSCPTPAICRSSGSRCRRPASKRLPRLICTFIR